MQKGMYLRSFVFLFAILLIFAFFGCAPPEGGADPMTMGPKEFLFGTVWYFLLGLFVYFILVLHPAQLREKDQDKFLKSLKKNDEVLTSSGFLGRVIAVESEYITLELGSNTRVRVLPRYLRPLSDKQKEALKVDKAGDRKQKDKDKEKESTKGAGKR